MIELNGIHGAYPSNCPVRAPRKAEGALLSVPTDRIKSDGMDLSPDAALHVEFGRAARAGAQKLSQPASSERIAALRQAYQGDQCPVSGRDVAKAILRSVTGS